MKESIEFIQLNMQMNQLEKASSSRDYMQHVLDRRQYGISCKGILQERVIYAQICLPNFQLCLDRTRGCMLDIHTSRNMVIFKLIPVVFERLVPPLHAAVNQLWPYRLRVASTQIPAQLEYSKLYIPKIQLYSALFSMTASSEPLVSWEQESHA